MIAYRMPSKPFRFVGVFKPLGEHATIFTLTESCTSIELNEVQGSLARVHSHVLFCSATGGGRLAENLKFYFP